MKSVLVLMAGAFALVLLAMLGLAAGVSLRKRTPLGGSCSRATCDPDGSDERGDACICVRQAAPDRIDGSPRQRS